MGSKRANHCRKRANGALPLGAVGLLLAVVFALGALGVFPGRAFTAWAGETDGQNLVDPTQRADNSFIYDTTVASLFSQASLYDDRTVQISGEVIGDCIGSDDPAMKWITLTETATQDKSSISVLLSSDQAGQISHYGRYGVVGTTLQVRGIYHQACDVHDGLPDVHATNSSVLWRGQDTPDQLGPNELVPGIVMVIIGLALMGAFYFVRERNR